jgi:hypothetical protein
VILNNIGLYKYDFMQAKIRNVSQWYLFIQL